MCREGIRHKPYPSWTLNVQSVSFSRESIDRRKVRFTNKGLFSEGVPNPSIPSLDDGKRNGKLGTPAEGRRIVAWLSWKDWLLWASGERATNSLPVPLSLINNTVTLLSAALRAILITLYIARPREPTHRLRRRSSAWQTIPTVFTTPWYSVFLMAAAAISANTVRLSLSSC